MKKIYFACSIRAGRGDVDIYGQLVEIIKAKAILLTEIFADQKLTPAGTNKPSPEIWRIDTDWVKESDAIIAEVTNPSLGVGYEIAKAEEWGKPVLALFRDDGSRRLSAMIDGSPITKVVYYTEIDQTESAIHEFLENV